MDWWYEDLPEGCKQAATALGYESKEHWDEDRPVPFDTKPFHELTLSEKRAAFHLGMNVLDKKLDIWWEDTDAGKLSYAGGGVVVVDEGAERLMAKNTNETLILTRVLIFVVAPHYRNQVCCACGWLQPRKLGWRLANPGLPY